MNNNKFYFAKLNENAKIPTKRDEDGGYDIYACFDEEYILIPPLESKLIPTGIASAFNKDYVAIFRERGSTGIKNIKINAGVIDSGFRNQWFVLLYNANTKPLIITKVEIIESLTEDYIVYPYSKAIGQFLVVPVLPIIIEEVIYNDILNIKSERGLGLLGSSNK